MEKKKIIIYSLLMVGIIAGIWFITNAYKPREINASNPEFVPYVSAYTSGVISKTSPIKIKLTSSVLENLDTAKISDKLIKFRPSIDGKLELKGNTIEFTPEKPLPSETEFYAEFKLDKIADVPSTLSSFDFSFKTIKQAFDLEIEEFTTIDKKTLKYQQISGIVNTADVEDEKSMAQVFTAKQNSKKLVIKWASETGGLKHYFTIDSIERYDKKSEIKLKWNGDKINADKEGDTVFTIPAITEFKFMSAKVVQHPDQYLQLQFSDPLDTKQDLNGLIQIAGNDNINYSIEDNIVKVFTQKRVNTEKEISISPDIKNILGYKLNKPQRFTMAFTALKPEIRFVGKGNILPASDKGLFLPFEAVNLKAVDLTVIKIYENNILQFLQTNDLDGDNSLRQVGTPVLRKTIHLDQFKITDYGSWNRFTLDLNKLISPEPGAVYRFELNFRKGHSLYQCDDDDRDTEEDLTDITEDWNNEGAESSNWDWYDNNNDDDDYYYYDYWEDRDNPCKKAYYGNRRQIARNIIASNLGIIAKQGSDKSMTVFVTDIKNTKPKEGVTVEIYDYQQQLLKSGTTDKDGKVAFKDIDKSYFALAKLGNQRGYLKTDKGGALSLSRFNVSGAAVKDGLKGFIYGERGVWRPGDSLFLTFILKEEAKKLPKGHPIVFEFTNPKGQLVKKEVQSKNDLNFYTFITETDDDAPTGNYKLQVTVGAATFTKTLKVETIKPNRLKIKLDFDKKMLTEGKYEKCQMNVKWLHGAVAKDLKVEVDATLEPVKTNFGVYNDYSFDNPTKHFYAESERILEGKTDAEGNIMLTADLNSNKESPGMMKATFVTRVYEKGGNFSIDQYTIPYSPYTAYVGVKLPKGDKMRGMLLTDKTHKVEIVTLTPEGKLLKDEHTVKLKFYKLNWRWWWDESANNVSSYNFKRSAKLLKSETVKTKGGKAQWDIEVKYPDWGRYLVIAEDVETGHSSGKIVYIDWPGWAGRAQGDSEGASMLTFSLDKSKYNVGDEATITIPSSKGGRALISIENGTKILKSYWVETKDKQTEFKLKLTADMTPNVYASVTLLQKHAQTANDLPIRMYGVKSIAVENPETHLQPVIKMPDELEAEKSFTLTVSEKDNKPMTYTIAVVDEGLLDLTRFRTPNPWKTFYAKEALGVNTWDLYDEVIGAFTGELTRLLSIGGDDSEDGNKSRKANRFKPVVKFLGPFTLEKGSKSHTIKMPKYIGSVRTMVIAGKGEAYGSAEKATPVIKPLMVLASLPRVLAPTEKVKLPISIFAMKENIKDVVISVKTNGLLSVIGNKSQKLRFNKPGEEDAEFELEVAPEVGIATVEILAKSGSNISAFNIEIDVRNPNQMTNEVLESVLNAGETWTSDYTPVGVKGTNSATLEISNIPPINLAQRLNYLIQYPHGCIEQTTSAVFPQLYVSDLQKLSKEQNNKIASNIKAGIKRLNKFQLSNGGFSYWPGNADANEWGTNYAGHFMLEANKKGYPVSPSMIKKWQKYQKTKARNWTNEGRASQLLQAYRLYGLALSGKPETGSMNRMKAIAELTPAAKWRLAAAYYLAGKKKIAQAMVEGLSAEVSAYNETDYTFGSDTRDKAMILEALVLMDEKTKAFGLLRDISAKLSENKYMSTQTTAYSLIAVSAYTKKHAKSSTLKYTYTLNGKSINISEKANISQQEIEISGTGAGKLSVKNTGKGMLYARFILRGIPEAGTASEASNALKLTVNYMLPDGTSISPNNIPQGSDFIAEVTVTNPGLKGNYGELALTQVFPSGWEIINTRMFDINVGKATSAPDYTDIRDDRVYTYFSLNRGKSKTFKVLLNASYAGSFKMPPVYCEAMYDETINARKGGGTVLVTKE